MSEVSNAVVNLDKITVYLDYACFICGIILRNAKTCIDHIEKIHRYRIPPRYGQRPENRQYTYVSNKNGPWTIEEYACPSCWFHAPSDDLESLNEHIREEHHPERIEKNGPDSILISSSTSESETVSAAGSSSDEDGTKSDTEFYQKVVEKLEELKSFFIS